VGDGYAYTASSCSTVDLLCGGEGTFAYANDGTSSGPSSVCASGKEFFPGRGTSRFYQPSFHCSQVLSKTTGVSRRGRIRSATPAASRISVWVTFNALVAHAQAEVCVSDRNYQTGHPLTPPQPALPTMEQPLAPQATASVDFAGHRSVVILLRALSAIHAPRTRSAPEMDMQRRLPHVPLWITFVEGKGHSRTQMMDPELDRRRSALQVSTSSRPNTTPVNFPSAHRNRQG
jgi:hypothetical protein